METQTKQCGCRLCGANREFTRIADTLRNPADREFMMAHLNNSVEMGCELEMLEEARKDSELSPVVLSFARKMEAALQANMHKGKREQWRARSGFWLQNKLARASGRLASCLETIKYAGGDREPAINSAVDLATYAMITADACGLEDDAARQAPQPTVRVICGGGGNEARIPNHCDSGSPG